MHSAADAFRRDGAVALEDAISDDACEAFYFDVLERLDIGELYTKWRPGGIEGSRLNWSADAALQQHYLPVLQHGTPRAIVEKPARSIKPLAFLKDILPAQPSTLPHKKLRNQLHIS